MLIMLFKMTDLRYTTCVFDKMHTMYLHTRATPFEDTPEYLLTVHYGAILYAGIFTR
jgi:hypothetical protein